jgi:hypothetical protein
MAPIQVGICSPQNSGDHNGSGRRHPTPMLPIIAALEQRRQFSIVCPEIVNSVTIGLCNVLRSNSIRDKYSSLNTRATMSINAAVNKCTILLFIGSAQRGVNSLSKLFALSAIASLVLALLGKLIAPDALISVHWRGTGYVYPAGWLSLAIAAVLCFFAAIYSLRLLPLQQKVGMWHFWLTILAIAAFWPSFYYLTRHLTSLGVSAAPLSGLPLVAALGLIFSTSTVIIAQSL